MLQKMVLASLVAGFTVAICIAGCNRPGKHAPDKPKHLPELSRDAADALFRSPAAQGMVERIRPQVLSEKNSLLKIKGLRVLSAVLLSRTEVMSRGTSLDCLSAILWAVHGIIAGESSSNGTTFTVQLARSK